LKLNTAGTTRFHLQISDNFPKRLSAEYEFNLYLIGFELCNNILKHAQATEAHIQLLNKDEQIQLIVEDNGCGLREEQHNEGMGLKNVKQRAADLGGEVEINHKSSGTIVTVKIRNTKPTKKPQTASVSKIR
jgi:signal transduction histidine kinase